MVVRHGCPPLQFELLGRRRRQVGSVETSPGRIRSGKSVERQTHPWPRLPSLHHEQRWQVGGLARHFQPTSTQEHSSLLGSSDSDPSHHEERAAFALGAIGSVSGRRALRRPL